MDSWITLTVLYGAGVLLLMADFILPSHGVLTLASFAMLGYALYLTFNISQQAGLVALLLLLAGVPAILAMGVRIWPRTWVGRRVSPPNPVLSEADRLPAAELEALIGRTGRSLTPLRPVGMCLFRDRRVECMAEGNMIGAGVEVEVIRRADRTLVVRPVPESGLI
jgi:membrane-bound serine protease (ClpP class)